MGIKEIVILSVLRERLSNFFDRKIVLRPIVCAQLHRALIPIEQDTTFVRNLIGSRRCLSCLFEMSDEKSSRLFDYDLRVIPTGHEA